MSPAALLAKGARLLEQVPESVRSDAVNVIGALVSGDARKAERLARNTALAIAAKRAAAERIKAKARL